ncbi:phosphotransferase [Photobacterium atrarenae]|uniref:Phosphotransferase n=1 Tax=Photobacterium atrarenae TaxID=865757 RepID=A0ABY5GHG3_9GAMM|nr:phosphotransferase [Photobacterium atrarenae]UTV28718.1 phosphotransferase [Photobacterium atrarenae]
MSFDPEVLGAALPDYTLLSARPLSGGLSNRCWQLTMRHRCTGMSIEAVWRPESAASRAFGLSREHEHRILSQLAPSGLAPASLRCFSPASAQQAPERKAFQQSLRQNAPLSGLLVAWVPGREADATFSDTALMQLLARIHHQPAPQWRLDVRAKAEHYWQYIHPQDKSPALQQLYHRFQATAPQAWFSDTCCHHDLGRYNIILRPDGGETVIDWEYASAGDPSLDLALTLNANGIDDTRQRAGAIRGYCRARGEQNVARWQQAVSAWQPWCDYLAMLWFYVGANLWQTPSYRTTAEPLLAKLSTKKQPDPQN